MKYFVLAYMFTPKQTQIQTTWLIWYVAFNNSNCSNKYSIGNLFLSSTNLLFLFIKKYFGLAIILQNMTILAL